MTITKAEFAAILTGLEIPVRYRAFKKGEKPIPPYAVYYQLSKEHFRADNGPYFTTETVVVELITKKKDEELEKKLESLLAANKLSFEFEMEDYLESEDLYQVSYAIDLM